MKNNNDCNIMITTINLIFRSDNSTALLNKISQESIYIKKAYEDIPNERIIAKLNRKRF